MVTTPQSTKGSQEPLSTEAQQLHWPVSKAGKGSQSKGSDTQQEAYKLQTSGWDDHAW